ncbi:MAG: hypothetical protein JWN44_5702 [Myxococcales bacterium]|nr:hypothetical protein [Myxococcales bacterium]
MKTLAPVVVVALVGVTTVGLVGGDPRGTGSMARSEWIVVAALLLCATLAAVAWRAARVSAWWLVPLFVVTVMGALSGWIAGVEFAGDTHVAARLATAPRKVAFLVAMVAAGLALPPSGVAALARRLGRARL